MERGHMARFVRDMVQRSHTGDMEMALRVLIAWKTASRWDEVPNLDPNQIIHCTDQQEVVDRWTGTKSSRGRPFRPSRFAVIEGFGMNMICAMVVSIRRRFAAQDRRWEKLSMATTMDLGGAFAAVEYMEEYSGQSMKHGAAAWLTEVDAKAEAEGKRATRY
eukprot:TRINITY_DN9746_c0_g1_i2.p3 TRINITY_DN9746_c0_g1~~TRINITY_DN9746_c0_g1_i2.p3  ORF type:complete len:162 (-),score=31.81 TRINITY_DN9746_c0_g1_i2:257-742(-)